MKDFVSDEEEKFYDLGEDTIDIFRTILSDKNIPFKIDTIFLGSTKLKKLIEIKKLTDVQSHLLGGKEMLVTINEDLLSKLDSEAINIQFEESINCIEVNLGNGKIKISKPKLTISPGMIKKHGIEKILRAHSLQDEVMSQSKDMETV